MIEISGSTSKVNALKSRDTAESSEPSASGEDFSAIIGGLDSKPARQFPGEQSLELGAATNSPKIDASGNRSPLALLISESLVAGQAAPSEVSETDAQAIAALESILQSGLLVASGPASVNVSALDPASVPLSEKLGARAPAELSIDATLSDRAKELGEKIERSADRITPSSAAVGDEILSPEGPKSTSLFRELNPAPGNASGGPLPLTDLTKTPILASGTDAPEALSALGAGSLSEAKAVAQSTTAANTHGQVPLGSPRFAEGFSQQVLLVAKDGLQTARISINPAELGPVDLRIVMRNDEVTIQLASQHLAVRDALQEALPRLREQFEQAGMRLEHSAVFRDLPNQTGHSGNSQDPGASESFADQSERGQTSDLEVSTSLTIRRGFVDAYV